MSEALSSSEIEDVLSSIRRLVSEDMRPAPRMPAAQAAGDKLILTPALRVVQNEGRLHLNLPSEDSHPAIEDVMAQVSAGVDQQGEIWESETGDVAPAPEATSTGTEWMLAEADDQPIDGWEDEVMGGDTRAAAGLVNDGDFQAEADDLYHLPEDPDAVAAPLAEPVAQALPGWAQQADSADEETAAQEPWTGGTVEPDQAWADEAEAQVLEELQGAAPAPDLNHDEFLLHQTEERALVDEDVLREIVRDIIREELQGRLGERITRNIRKLVRAEIARVMAADDLL